MKNLIILSLALFIGSPMLFAHAKNAKTDTAQHTIYTCPMHPEVVSNKPGKCPKCGMTLVAVKNPQTKTYTCSMHPDVVSSKPGKCPKCGMMLVEKKDGKNMDASMHKMQMHNMDSSIHKMPMQHMDSSIKKMPMHHMDTSVHKMPI